jgi:alkanesulfonate monooxygenase SsuD/methylene tetrahydromethanopterin reductase-like flavin-dependent oxidoreductase (luciferase family)
LGVGTCVVPINPRHPLIVASLAAQAASHGNFSLGLCRRHFRQDVSEASAPSSTEFSAPSS